MEIIFSSEMFLFTLSEAEKEITNNHIVPSSDFNIKYDFQKEGRVSVLHSG